MKKKVLSIALAACMMVSVFGAAGMCSFAADSVTVKCTISDGGAIKAANKTLTVTDCDGIAGLGVGDVLYTAHEKFFAGGAAAGYDTEWNTSYNTNSITKFWGHDAPAASYYKNDTMCNSLSDSISDGDYIYGFVYKNADWSDCYSFFDKKFATVKVNENLNLFLTCKRVDESWTPYDQTVSGADIIVSGNVDNVLATTDENGKAAVKFTKAGTYLVTADYKELTLVPPVCVVTVTADSNAISSVGDRSPQTGDPMNLMFYAVIFASLTGAGVAYRLKRAN